MEPRQIKTIPVFLPVQGKQVDGKKIGKNWSCWYEIVLSSNKCIDPNNLQGRGAFGSVVKARNRIDSRIYAGSRRHPDVTSFHALIDVYSEEDPPSYRSERHQNLP